MSVINGLLEIVVPDVTDVLDIGFSGTATQTGGKKQIIRYGSDGRRRVTTLGEKYFFFIELGWEVLESDKKNIILNFFYNKTNGMEKSFVWRGYHEDNKTDYVDYVVYFDTDLSTSIGQVVDSIPNVKLSIKGKLV